MAERAEIACWLVVLLAVHIGQPTRGRADADSNTSRRLTLGADLVIGRGETLTLDQTASRAARADVECSSLVIGATYAIAAAIEVSLQLPLTLLRILPPESDSRLTFAPGNVELEGEIEAVLAAGLAVQLALVIALPTATGRELPSSAALETMTRAAAARRRDDYDAFAAQRAATSARGHEEDPLFEPDHLGLVPTVSIDYRAGVFALHGYIEFENLIRTDPRASHAFIGEIDLGIHARYLPTEVVELAAKAWTNAGLIGESDMVLAVEPQLRLHLAQCDFAAGLVLPIAGEWPDTSFVGVRLVAAVRM